MELQCLVRTMTRDPDCEISKRSQLDLVSLFSLKSLKFGVSQEEQITF